MTQENKKGEEVFNTQFDACCVTITLDDEEDSMLAHAGKEMPDAGPPDYTLPHYFFSAPQK